jgi:hypothetical protein
LGGDQDPRRSSPDILFFVGMHPRDFWVTQPKSHVHTPMRRDLKIKACFIVSGHFCSLVTILKTDSVVGPLAGVATTSYQRMGAQGWPSNGPQCDQPRQASIIHHSRQTPTLRHLPPAPPKPVTEGTPQMAKLSLEGD